MMKDQESIEPVIVDFGLAVYEDDSDYYYVCGTPGFISPEILSLK
jgi:serine/threonine protein kinase